MLTIITNIVVGELEVGLVCFCFVFKVDIVIGIVLLVCGPVGLFGLQLQTLYTVSLYLLRAKQPHQFYFVRKRVGAGRPKRQHFGLVAVFVSRSNTTDGVFRVSIKGCPPSAERPLDTSVENSRLGRSIAVGHSF